MFEEVLPLFVTYISSLALACFTSFLSVQLLLRLYSRSLSLTSASNYVGTMLTAVSWVITFAIAGNIALSLGMIGALSVVRFRTPVKSPVDLVNFFYFVTLGIAFSTRILSGLILFVGFYAFWFFNVTFYLHPE